MDYFKHYATGSDSKSLNQIFDKYKHKGIAFWWMFLELCSENWDGQSEPEFTFHVRTVATKLKSSATLVTRWLEFTSTLGMTSIEINDSLITVCVPKLSEVKTSRKVIKSNKKQLTVYIEENKNRIDIDKEKEVKQLSKSHIFNISQTVWNEKYGANTKLDKAVIDLTRDDISNLVEACKKLKTKDEWVEFYNLCDNTFLTDPKSGDGWTFSFSWSIKPENLVKIQNKTYSKVSVALDEKTSAEAERKARGLSFVKEKGLTGQDALDAMEAIR